MFFPIRTNNRKGAVFLGKRGKTSSQWNCCRQFHGGLSKMLASGYSCVTARHRSGDFGRPSRNPRHPCRQGEKSSRAAVLRARESPANIHRLCEIRDAADNMPAVNAIKTLEGLDEDLMRRNTDTPTPGIVLRIVNMAPQPVPIDITPRPSPIIDAGD
jgi:hypothetical protein